MTVKNEMKKFLYNKSLHTFLLLFVCLVIADQGAKLLVANLTTVGQTAIPITDFFRIRPLINDIALRTLTQLSERLSVPYGVLLFANILKRVVLISVSLILLYLIAVHILFLPKKHPHLLRSILSLMSAATMCSCIDDLVHPGTLDYLGIIFRTGQQQVGDHTHPQYGEIIFDLKDLYIWCAVALLLLLLFVFFIDYLRCGKERRKEIDQAIKLKLRRLLPIKKHK